MAEGLAKEIDLVFSFEEEEINLCYEEEEIDFRKVRIELKSNGTHFLATTVVYLQIGDQS
ncbi:hypothetical protein FRX31_022861 [Thalictrum thalictroides]|uniref:Uncharacterized protein n=1 Tax=Thalictrum thalictroides TaxID=46969 RepID=A0A7J6VT54_THATH|nr:hypothetical protein FRX31_022861 [Thalictrum thalictroides]